MLQRDAWARPLVRLAPSFGCVVAGDLAQAIVACGFCVGVTATFRLLYVSVVMEHITRRILQLNVTPHPTALLARQLVCEAIPADHAYPFLMHEPETTFLSENLAGFRQVSGLRVEDWTV